MTVAEPRDLVELLQRMEYWRQEPTVEKQRAFRRFSVRGHAALEPIDTDMVSGPVTVMLRDISRGGAGFVCEEFLDVASTWRMTFKKEGFRIGSQPIVVRFCRLIQDGLYLVGSQFTAEPYIIHALGVPSHELANDVNDVTHGNSANTFVSPSALED
jgi:hypothetical protein